MTEKRWCAQCAAVQNLSIPLRDSDTECPMCFVSVAVALEMWPFIHPDENDGLPSSPDEGVGWQTLAHAVQVESVEMGRPEAAVRIVAKYFRVSEAEVRSAVAWYSFAPNPYDARDEEEPAP